MHEGKNIHFSPVDNKPLCSYSNKLCRQRRLNGYAFCIRHILEDKSAPFKQCSFVTRNNCQKCLNAIPTNQERGYCHSHMQVIGIIPKTERKAKSSSALPAQTGKIMLKKSYSSNTSSSISIDPCNTLPETATVSKEGIYDYDDDSLPSPPTLLLKGKMGSNSICHDKVATASRENNVSLKEKNAAEDNNIVYKNDNSDSKVAVNSSNWKIHKNKHLSNIISEEKRITTSARSSPKSRETPKPILSSNTEAKPVLKSKLTIPVKIPSCAVAEAQVGVTNGGSLVRDTWRTFKFNNISSVEEDKFKPLHQYEQMKTLKTLRKLPLFIDGPLSVYSPPSQSTQNQVINSSSSDSSTLRIPISKSSFSNDFKSSIKRSAALEILMTPPFLNLRVNNKCTQQLSNGLSDGEEDNKSYDLCITGENGLSIDGIAIRNQESRQQFLCRVRKAFKSQYRTIKRACKISEKHERRDKRAFRNSLLTCVMNNPGFCAQVLVQGNNEGSCKNTTSSNEFTITNLANHIRNGSTQKLIINELKSGSTKLNPASLSKSNKRDKSKTLPNLTIKSDAESKPIVKLLDIDNKVSNADNINNLNSVLKTEGKKYKPTDIGCNLPTADATKVKKKQRLRGNVSGSTISSDDVESKNTPDASMDCVRWDILEGLSTVKCSSSTKIMTSSSLLSGILKNGPLSANFRKRKNDNESLEPHIGYDGVPVVIKTEVVESWNSEGAGLCTNSSLSNHPETIVNNPNSDINSLLHCKDRNDVSENCSASKQSKNELQARLLQIQMNHNQLISCANPKVGPHSSSSVDTVDTPKNITDTSVGSPFDQPTSNHRDGHDCHFTDEDVDQNLELQLDPEIAQQASRLLEENELTEDDFNELFPDTRMGDQKMVRTDLSDLGIDFASNIDTNDVDYSLFANIFPNVTRSIQHSSIFVNNQF